MKMTKLDDNNAIVHVRLDKGWEAELLIAGLNVFQARVKAWSDERLPERAKEDPLLNLAEEVGELSRAVLKGRQKIRFTQEEIARMKRDEAADVLFALLDFCALEGFSLAEAARDLFEKKNHPSYDEFRAADKKRRDASGDLVGALSTSLLAMRRAGLTWQDISVREALGALTSASSFTREELVGVVDDTLETERKSSAAGKAEVCR